MKLMEKLIGRIRIGSKEIRNIRTKHIIWQESKSNEKKNTKTDNKGKLVDFINCNRCESSHKYWNYLMCGEWCRNCDGYRHFARMCKKSERKNENNSKRII